MQILINKKMKNLGIGYILQVSWCFEIVQYTSSVFDNTLFTLLFFIFYFMEGGRLAGWLYKEVHINEET